MNLAQRLLKIAQTEHTHFADSTLPRLKEMLGAAAKPVVDFADELLTEAERRTFGEEVATGEDASKGVKQKTQRQSQKPPPTQQRSPVNPASSAARPFFTDFGDFLTAFEGVKSGKLELGDHQILKLIDAAQGRGFTDKLCGWVSKPGNSETILIPLARLLLTPSSDDKLHDRIFYRVHQLGLQEELLRWMVSGPNASLRLTDTLGSEYAAFNAQ